MYKENYDKERFHIEFGPASLFERVRFKMKDVRALFIEGSHFKTRVDERDIPVEVIEKLMNFNVEQWKLKTAEVRKDRGKFVNSTWEIEYSGCVYWVTIGIGNYIKTIVQRNSSGVEKCIKSGEYYDFVEHVNNELMNAEKCNI